MGKRITRDSRNNRPGQLNKNNIARFIAHARRRRRRH